jgi:hypothetical protein
MNKTVLKKFVELSGDILGMFILIGIILTSAAAVFGLSPLAAEQFGYKDPSNIQILGLETSESSSIDFQIYESSKPYFSIELQSDDQIVIKSEPIQGGRYQVKLMKIINNSEYPKSFRIKLNTDKDVSDNAILGITEENQDFILINPRFENSKIFNATIKGNSSTDLSFFIKPEQDLNFPFELKLVYEEIEISY